MSLVPNILSGTVNTTAELTIGRDLVLTTTDWDSIVPFIEQDINNNIAKAMPFLKNRIKLLLQRVVPVRSGKLLDTMINNLRAEMIGNRILIQTTVPAGYPMVIPNPAHDGQIGWAKKYTPTNNITNRIVVRDTEKGAYYLLNDPTAESNYLRLLGFYSYPFVSRLIDEQMNNGYNIVLKQRGVTWKDIPGAMRLETLEGNVEYRVPVMEGSAAEIAEKGAGGIPDSIEVFGEQGNFIRSDDPWDNVDFGEMGEDVDEEPDDEFDIEVWKLLAINVIGESEYNWMPSDERYQAEDYEGGVVDFSQWND